MVLDNIAMILQDECRLDPQVLSVIGVSGGPDSLCLVHVMHNLGFRLLAVHVNHGLRPEADQEASTVETLLKSLGIDVITCQVDVRSYTREKVLSIEEAARVMRYQVLFELAEKTGAASVLVAHNADDQVETILMHLLRGSGVAGLRGMEYRKLPNAWSARIPLIRPLISTWREEILEYLTDHRVTFVSDQSNFDTTFFRNRLRHELLPHLENYNPRIRQNLLRMSQVNKDDYEVLQELVSQAWHTALVRQGAGYVAFHLPTFKNLPVSTQRYLLRKAIAYHLPSLRDIDFDSIERGIAFLCRDRKVGQVDLTAGLRLVKEQDTFWLATWQADLDGSEYPAVGEEGNLLLDIPSVLQLGNDWSMHAVEELDSVEAHQYYADNQDPFQAWLDVENLVLPLIVRIRKTGERFQPLGMEGHTLKVSDLMVNLKMPKRARPTWPLVCSGKDILWIPGYRQAHLGRVHPGSRRIIHLTLRKSSTS